MKKKRAIVTISALNYAARVEVAVRTFKKFHPDIPFHYFVLDDRDGSRSKKVLKTQAKVSYLNELVEHFERSQSKDPIMGMLFPYDVMEASTAVKPFVLMYLLEAYGYDEVLFVDPDTMFVNSLDVVWEAFSQGDFLLTPHLLTFGDITDAFVAERAVLQTGVFNLGFLGVANKPAVKEFLGWWAKRLAKFCLKDIRNGYFTDQRWIDAAFGATKNAVVLRDHGLNVAHWNAHERRIWLDSKGVYRSNKDKLRFLHFSGYEPKDPTSLSRYRPDLKLKDLGTLETLANDYRKLLKKFDNDDFERIPYGYDYFSNGVKIPSIVRDWTRKRFDADRFDNPFDVDDRRSFFNYLLRSSGTDLCPLASLVKDMRQDVRLNFPGDDVRTNATYMKWLVEKGCVDHKIDPKIVRLLKSKLAVYKGMHA